MVTRFLFPANSEIHAEANTNAVRPGSRRFQNSRGAGFSQFCHYFQSARRRQSETELREKAQTGRFARVSIAMIQAFKATGSKPTERLVGFMLADHHNDGTGRCDPSISLLAHETGLDERSIGRAIQRLEISGHLTVCRRSGARSSYQLHPIPQAGPPAESRHRQRVATGRESGPPPAESRGDPRQKVGTPPAESRPNHNKPEGNRKLNHNTGPEVLLRLDETEEERPTQELTTIEKAINGIFFEKRKPLGQLTKKEKQVIASLDLTESEIQKSAAIIAEAKKAGWQFRCHERATLINKWESQVAMAERFLAEQSTQSAQAGRTSFQQADKEARQAHRHGPEVITVREL